MERFSGIIIQLSGDGLIEGGSIKDDSPQIRRACELFEPTSAFWVIRQTLYEPRVTSEDSITGYLKIDTIPFFKLILIYLYKKLTFKK